VTAAALGLTLASSAFLFVYGLNLVHLAVRAIRLRPVPLPPATRGEEPLVCVQLPVYNERYVAERVIDAACGLEWPGDRFEVQVLDDSDDDTVEIAGRAVARWRGRGVRIRHVRRPRREGYKAGALAHGLELTQAPVICVLDADFVPAPDLLRRTVGGLADARVAFVQARWGHLNEGYSFFTRLQALMVDFHFLVEQAVRPAAGWPTNFTGTAGIWRRAAIVDAGGWSARTLTEDLDLSYRAQLRGWRAVYMEDVVVPQELPVAVAAYRGQQMRWATGSFQTAFRLLVPVLRSRLSPMAKLQAVLHLLGYAAPLLMLVQIACYPVLLLTIGSHLSAPARVPLLVNLVSLAPVAGFAAAQARRGPGWWRRMPAIMAWSFVGAGTSLTVLVALLRAFRVGEFNRTPKYRIEKAGQEWRDGQYVRIADPFMPAELLLGGGMLALALLAFNAGQWLLAAYALLFGFGFLFLGGLAAVQAIQVLTLRRLGRGALDAVTGAARVLLVAGPAAALLTAFAGLGLGFEDSYQHWLAAATLATTGHLHDPLFGMEDTWLPAYQYVAAGVLLVAGTWNLAALRALSIALSVVVLLLTQRLAGGQRRGRVAVVLLALNPVFLLTGTEVVAEPLLMVFLLGAVLALRDRRYRVAAVLAALACLTGTKAWLWLGLLVAVQGLSWLAPARSRPALGWAVPALAVLALLQLGFAPASHSVDRASVEVASATVRGSIAGGISGRAGSFAGWFLVASLPLVVLAPLGFYRDLRAGSPLVRLLHLPSLGYLVVVTGLVAAGLYSGSHRYYELALPSLAILAAGAVDAVPLATLAAAGAAAAIALVYVPIATAFAAENSGVLAAGRAASTVPGALLTDSPAAAYASGKPPGQVLGSRALPAGSDAALAYLQGHGFGSLVLEDVSYYRATQVFPGLSTGTQQGPFQPLGPQSAYRVDGGKPVSAWVLPPATLEAPVAAAAWLCANPAEAPRTGKIADLAKGPVLQLSTSPSEAAGEGTGFGVPFVRFSDGWVFAGDAVTTDLSGGGSTVWRKTFALDRLERDDASGHFIGFQAIPARGQVVVDYRLVGDRLNVAVTSVGVAGALEVVVANEVSAAFDDVADPRGTHVGAGIGPGLPMNSGWARFRSASLGLEWVLERPPAASMTAGRELDPALGLNWAGLELHFGPGFQSTSYAITFGRAR
jgi:cellulose synthase/poly-beta-1,6-N-acetylglucosamine synthase-like glycosyltransferase